MAGAGAISTLKPSRPFSPERNRSKGWPAPIAAGPVMGTRHSSFWSERRSCGSAGRGSNTCRQGALSPSTNSRESDEWKSSLNHPTVSESRLRAISYQTVSSRPRLPATAITATPLALRSQTSSFACWRSHLEHAMEVVVESPNRHLGASHDRKPAPKTSGYQVPWAPWAYNRASSYLRPCQHGSSKPGAPMIRIARWSALLLILMTLVAASIRSASAQDDAQAQLDATAAAMLDLTSFHFKLETTAGRSVFQEAFELKVVEGDLVRPANFQAAVEVKLAIVDLTLEVISVDGNIWVK